MQLSYFQSTVIELGAILGETQATTLLHNSLFMIEHGSNDYLYNYLMPNSSSAALYTPAQFHKYLVSVYKTQLTVCSVDLVSLSLIPQDFYLKRARFEAPIGTGIGFGVTVDRQIWIKKAME